MCIYLYLCVYITLHSTYANITSIVSYHYCLIPYFSNLPIHTHNSFFTYEHNYSPFDIENRKE